MAELFADQAFADDYFAQIVDAYESYESREPDAADPALDSSAPSEDVVPDLDELRVPGAPGMGVEDLNRYARVVAARQDQLFHQVLTDAAVNPEPWTGPDPTGDPWWTPPANRTAAAVRARRRDMAVRGAVMDIAVRTRMTENQVHTRAHRAQTLSSRCPNLWAAYLAGDISEQNAGTAATMAAILPSDAKEAWAAFDTALVRAAGRLTSGKFRAKARAVRDRIHPVPLAERHARAAEGRDVWVIPQFDGMSSVEALVPGVTGTAIEEYLDVTSRSLAALPDETRTLAQLRADIFADLLLNGGLPRTSTDTTGPTDADATESHHETDADALPTETDADDSTAPTPCSTLPWLKGIAATVRVTIPALTLLGHSDEPAVLDGYGPIDTETARRLAGNAASWIRVLTHPVTGTVLDVDRRMYRVPADLRRWLETKHPTCVAPGCNRPARRCDFDHRKRWADGGTTCADNLGPLCEHHHCIKDETLWTLVRHPDVSAAIDSEPGPAPEDEPGSLTWVSPTGHTTDADPPPF